MLTTTAETTTKTTAKAEAAIITGNSTDETHNNNNSITEHNKIIKSIDEREVPQTSTQTTKIVSGPDELRDLICDVLSSSSSSSSSFLFKNQNHQYEEEGVDTVVVGIILNYHMTTLGQSPYGGHLSPLAAYHAPTDTVLLLDCWHATEPVWTSITTIWTAMAAPVAPLDTEPHKQRGLVVVVTQG